MKAKKEGRYGIAQSVNGVPGGEPVHTEPNTVDNGHSSITGGSTFAQFYNGKKIPSTPKDSDDQILIGYSQQGLPFQILVDGYYGCTGQPPFELIETLVAPLMAKYSQRLSSTEDVNEVITDQILEIEALRQTIPEDDRPEFTMAVAITYKNGEKLYCAGFGIGDIGLVLHRKKTNEVEQLAATTYFEGKDGFDSRFTQRSKTIIGRCDRFNVEIEPGDEVVGYTSLLRDLVDQERVTKSGSQGDAKKLKKTLVPEDPETSLFEAIKAANDTAFEAACSHQEVQEGQGEVRFGDDCMIGAFTVPDSELQLRLINEIAASNPSPARDIGIVAGSIVIPAGLGAGIGAVLGTFIFPGLGTVAGALLGAFFGASIGLTIAGAQALFRGRLAGGNHTEIERSASASLITAGLGALIGTILFPGIGTAIGLAVGGLIGVTGSIGFIGYKRFTDNRLILQNASSELVLEEQGTVSRKSNPWTSSQLRADPSQNANQSPSDIPNVPPPINRTSVQEGRDYYVLGLHTISHELVADDWIIDKLKQIPDDILIFNTEEEAIAFADEYCQAQGHKKNSGFTSYTPVLKVSLKQEDAMEERVILDKTQNAITFNNIESVFGYTYRLPTGEFEKVDFEESLTPESVQKAGLG